MAGRSTSWNQDCWEKYQNLGYADDTTLMAESEKELKSLLMKVKEESEKVGFKLNIQITKIMSSGLVTSWEIDGETVSDFIFWVSEVIGISPSNLDSSLYFFQPSVSHEAVVVAESLRQKLGLAYPWAGGGGGDTSHQRRHKQANLFAQVPIYYL